MNSEYVRIYGVVKMPIQNAEEYIHGYQLNYPIIIISEENEVFTKEYQVKYVPTTILINKHGVVVKSYTGAITKNRQAEIIREINNRANIILHRSKEELIQEGDMEKRLIEK